MERGRKNNLTASGGSASVSGCHGAGLGETPLGHGVVVGVIDSGLSDLVGGPLFRERGIRWCDQSSVSGPEYSKGVQRT